MVGKEISLSEEVVLSVIVPCLNSGDILVECVKSVVEQRLDDLELILVDNGSDDGSVKHAAALHPNVRIVINESNRGYAAACNQGARVAEGTHLLFLNDDVALGAECIKGLLAAAQSSECRILQPVSYRMDGALDSAGKAITDWGFLLPADPGPEPVASIFAADGACMLVDREPFELLGGFVESYFAYFEDSDLCWRARMKGWEVGLARQASVTHHGQATTRRVLTPGTAAFLSYRNRLRSVIANPSRSRLAGLLPLHVAGLLGAAVAFSVRGRLGEASGVLRALVWPLINLSEAVEQRRSSQRARTVSDELIFRQGLVKPMTLRLAIGLLSGSLQRWKRWPLASTESTERTGSQESGLRVRSRH
jgi:GT2 family glycosyltransferase